MTSKTPSATRASPIVHEVWWASRRFQKILPGWPCVALASLAGAIMVAAAAAPQNKAQITVAATIVIEPASRTQLPIEIGPQELIPRNSLVRLRGLPAAVSLTEGYAIGPGIWAIPLVALPALKANVPIGTTGHFQIIITLVDFDGSLLSEARTTLVVEPRSTNGPPQRTLTEQMSTGYLAEPAQKSLTSPHNRQLPAEARASAEKLVAMGRRYLEQGNIEVARQFFRRAANAGLAEGAMRLAATYDAAELARLGVQGVVADSAEALRWYERARELGADASQLATQPSGGPSDSEPRR
jgi:hypothetical protein